MKSLETAFATAVQLEERGDLENAAICYQALMSDDARAAVNLGVIHTKQKQHGLAADAFRHAVKIAPDFALAWFNLGNAMTELFDSAEAVKAYEMALRIAPRYADAHYNLAGLLESKREHRRALKHWRAYIKLDPTGNWSDRARRAIKKTMSVEKLAIVWRQPA